MRIMIPSVKRAVFKVRDGHPPEIKHEASLTHFSDGELRFNDGFVGVDAHELFQDCEDGHASR